MKKKIRVSAPIDVLTTGAVRLADGMENCGESIGITFASPAQMRTAIGELLQSESVYQTALGDLTAKLSPALQQADAQGQKFILRSKKILRLQLGERWNQNWSQAGFLNNTIQTPKTLAEREALLLSLTRYFGADKSREATGQGITADRAQKLHAAFAGAQKALAENRTRQKELRAKRDEAAEKLRMMVRGVLAEIRVRLSKDSPQWDAFGLSAPKARKRKVKSEGETSGQGTVPSTATGASTAVVPMAA